MICSFTLICACCCHMLMAVLNMNVSYTGAKRGAVWVKSCDSVQEQKQEVRDWPNSSNLKKGEIYLWWSLWWRSFCRVCWFHSFTTHDASSAQQDRLLLNMRGGHWSIGQLMHSPAAEKSVAGRAKSPGWWIAPKRLGPGGRLRNSGLRPKSSLWGSTCICCWKTPKVQRETHVKPELSEAPFDPAFGVSCVFMTFCVMVYYS